MTMIHPSANLLAGKTAIVTGAAMGLGKAMARVFVREGARVLAVDRDPAVEAVTEEIGAGCTPFRTDLGTEAGVKAMFDKAREIFGKLDIIVNNAATIHSDTAEFSIENYDAFTQTNFFGLMLCTREAIEMMVPAGGGTIVNVSSVGSLNTEERAPIIYSAGKAAVNSLTRAVAVKYGAMGIRANVLAPGFTHIEKTAKVRPESIAPMEQKSAFKRGGDVEEQAQAAVFLASDRSSYVNGVVLPVDGGWSARMA